MAHLTDCPPVPCNVTRHTPHYCRPIPKRLLIASEPNIRVHVTRENQSITKNLVYSIQALFYVIDHIGGGSTRVESSRDSLLSSSSIVSRVIHLIYIIPALSPPESITNRDDISYYLSRFCPDSITSLIHSPRRNVSNRPHHFQTPPSPTHLFPSHTTNHVLFFTRN